MSAKLIAVQTAEHVELAKAVIANQGGTVVEVTERHRGGFAVYFDGLNRIEVEMGHPLAKCGQAG